MKGGEYYESQRTYRDFKNVPVLAVYE